MLDITIALMYQFLEPIVASGEPSIPWPIAAAAGTAMAATIGVLWRRVVTLEERNRQDYREVLPVLRDSSDATRDLATSVQGLAEKVEDVLDAKAS